MDRPLNTVSTAPLQTSPVGPGGAQFYIPATNSVFERRQQTLKRDDTFALFDARGDIVHVPGGSDGLYHKDTRFLSRLEFFLDEHQPILLSSTLQDDNSALTVDLVNPDLYKDKQIVLSREMLHITRTIFLLNGACYQRLALKNFDSRPHVFRLMFAYEADFADLFEVRGLTRARHGTSSCEVKHPDAVRFRYVGLDNIERLTEIGFQPAPTALTEAYAGFQIVVEPHAQQVICVVVRAGSAAAEAPKPFSAGLRQARRTLRHTTSRFCGVETSNEFLNQVFVRGAADLAMLITETPEGPYPYAGIPWFSTAFGRDGIITALQTLWLDPSIARGVLKFLAAHQAHDERPDADAEPGKILHEMRDGEMAHLNEIPFGRYYGSVDATPLFVLLAGRYFARTGDAETIKAIRPNVEAALAWIDSYGDPDGDGFVEYHRRTEQGLVNQGWKDSHDSVPCADGRLARGPIALCEVQGYVYAAKLAAAEIARAFGDGQKADSLVREAEDLRAEFERAFWLDELGTYALALDGEKTPCRVRASNPGHALFCGIAEPARAERTAATLLSRESFSGWGIRTMAAVERRFNPMSYHNGSVWPHDNSIIALGFARYGLREAALKVFEAQFDAARYMDLFRLPELFCGFPRRKGRAPTRYPVACSPQAWAAAAPFALLEASLGLSLDAAAQEIRFNNPALPKSVAELRLSGLRLDGAVVDVQLTRRDTDVAVDVLRRDGDVKVVVTK